MVLINLHRNLHEKSSFLSEIMFIRINPYLCHLLTRYQSTIFPNHKSCVRKKGVPASAGRFFCVCAACQQSVKRLSWCSSVKAKKHPMIRHITASSALSTRGEGFVGRPALSRMYSRKKRYSAGTMLHASR